jgi:hypothetical protein
MEERSGGIVGVAWIYTSINFLNGYDMENQYNEMRRDIENETKAMMAKALAYMLFHKYQAEICCRQIDEVKICAKCLDEMTKRV